MKKLLILILVLTLTLSGCFLSDNSTAVIEGEEHTYTFTKDTVYLLYRETVTYPDGTEYFREFDNELTIPGSNYIFHGIQKANGEETGTCYREYDPEGNLILENDGTTEYRYELTYDEANQLIKKVTYVNDDETVTEEYAYTDGHVTQTTVSENGAVINRYETIYDANGHRKETTKYDTDGKILGTTQYERKDSQETAKDYSPDGVLIGYQVNVYAYSDKLAKEECFSPEGELLKTSVWWYLGFSYSNLDIE